MSTVTRRPRGPAGASRAVRTTVLALVLALHLVVLYLPRAPSLAPPGVRVDLLVHVGVFATLALSARWAGLPWRPVGAVLAVEAVVSELVQALFLPHRSGDPTDLVADLLGTALGLWLGARGGRRAPS